MKGNFQIIMVVIFIGFAVLAIMVFSGVIPIGEGNKQVVLQGRVVLWGTVPKTTISSFIDDFNASNKTFEVSYVQKFPDTFDKELLEALASGTGPDLFFLPDDLAYGYTDKIFTIPYSNYPLVNFKNTFASAGEVFLTKKGILAFPISVDPLMMYYNRSILDANNIVYPPVYWDEFADMVKVITKRDDSNQIIKSAVALGQFSNVNNAKDILSTLFMQMGSGIVGEDDGGIFRSNLTDSGDKNIPDLGPVLDFYTSFADPLKDTYSWNKSLQNSQNVFSSNNLAFYFGFASELGTLVKKNPNQNFLVAPMPQVKNADFKVTKAKVTGIAVSAFSKNFNTAYATAGLLASGDFAKKYVDTLGVAPARRDLLATKPTDDYFPAFYSSALYSKSWLDPSPADTDNVFRLMVDSVLSNGKKPKEAVGDASSRLNLLLLK